MLYFFGDKKTAVAQVTMPEYMHAAWQRAQELAQRYGLQKIIFPYQVHGVKGLVIERENGATTESFTCEADWVITDVPGVGVGVLTADCVPILVHDTVTGAIGAIHAGWRGAVDGVVIRALEAMERTFGVRATDLHIFIGPHARNCCYNVDQQFYDTVMQKTFGRSSWHNNETGLFFDLLHCCMEQLKKTGVHSDAINDVNICTVCTPAYCSYRREKDAVLRNVSLIAVPRTH